MVKNLTFCPHCWDALQEDETTCSACGNDLSLILEIQSDPTLKANIFLQNSVNKALAYQLQESIDRDTDILTQCGKMFEVLEQKYDELTDAFQAVGQMNLEFEKICNTLLDTSLALQSEIKNLKQTLRTQRKEIQYLKDRITEQ